jgi:hypothetical protein
MALQKVTTILKSVLSETLSESDAKSVLKAFTARMKKESPTSESKSDSTKPKHWRSAYIHFSMANRKNNEGKTPADTLRNLGKAWKELPVGDRKPYEEASALEKKEYEELTGTVSKKSKSKTQTGPRRPLSSYMFFCKTARKTLAEEHPEMKGKFVTTEMGRMWSELTPEDKQQYIEMANADKLRYKQETAGTGSVTEEKTASRKKQAPPKPIKEESEEEDEEVSEEEESEGEEEEDAAFREFADKNRSKLASKHPSWNAERMDTELRTRWSRGRD